MLRWYVRVLSCLCFHTVSACGGGPLLDWELFIIENFPFWVQGTVLVAARHACAALLHYSPFCDSTTMTCEILSSVCLSV